MEFNFHLSIIGITLRVYVSCCCNFRRVPLCVAKLYLWVYLRVIWRFDVDRLTCIYTSRYLLNRKHVGLAFLSMLLLYMYLLVILYIRNNQRNEKVKYENCKVNCCYNNVPLYLLRKWFLKTQTTR